MSVHNLTTQYISKFLSAVDEDSDESVEGCAGECTETQLEIQCGIRPIDYVAIKLLRENSDIYTLCHQRTRIPLYRIEEEATG